MYLKKIKFQLVLSCDKNHESDKWLTRIYKHLCSKYSKQLKGTKVFGSVPVQAISTLNSYFSTIACPVCSTCTYCHWELLQLQIKNVISDQRQNSSYQTLSKSSDSSSSWLLKGLVTLQYQCIPGLWRRTKSGYFDISGLRTS